MRQSFLKKNWQIAYGIILVVLVPVIVVVNTIILNRTFQNNIDVQLQRQALSLGRTLNATLQQSLDNVEHLNLALERTVETSPDVKQLIVLEPQAEGFRVVAGTWKQGNNQMNDNPQYYLAWYQNEAIATLVSRAQLLALYDSLEIPVTEGERYWLVTMPLKDAGGNKKYLLSMAVSLQVMDDIISATLVRSYIILAFIVLLLILLLAANARLFEFAVLYRKIKEVDEMKDEFISIASHELRTPLTVIRGYVSIMMEGAYGELGDKPTAALVTINNSVERLASLVEDLLQVSRIEQGRLKLEVTEFSPTELVKETVEEMIVAAKEKGLELSLATEGEMPVIRADHDRLKQVLVNIIGNSIKYTVHGTVKLTWQLKDKYWQLKVTDTGIGMTAKERERLFEKFYRVKKDETKEVTGTGLGLWITKQIVELMKGEIYVDSIENVGTDVTILIPLVHTA